MKEKIYTIPINEAYEGDHACPLCFLEEKLESDAVKYALGAAMMEPDYRTESNEKGYCRRHFEQMLKVPNKLSLALVLETHLQELSKNLEAYEKEITSEKSGIFKKSTAAYTARKISGELDRNEHSCIICDKVKRTALRYCDVLLYMWANDSEFRRKFQNSKGTCLKHEKMLLDTLPKALNDKQAREFTREFYTIQKRELKALSEKLHRFVLKFDYRYHDTELGDAKTAVPDTIEKISGYINKSS